MNRLATIAARAKAEQVKPVAPRPIKDGVAERQAALQEAANAFARGEGNWL